MRCSTKIGCPPRLQNLGSSVLFNGAVPAPFEMKSGLKPVYVLATTLFGISSAVLHHAFHDNKRHAVTDGVFLRIRTDGRLSSFARLRTRTKHRHVPAHEFCLQTMPLYFHAAKMGFQSQNHLRVVLPTADEAFYLVICYKKLL